MRVRGFTLLEVAIAMAILGLGVVTVMQVFSGSVRLQSSAAARTKAVLYARTLLDQALGVVEMNPAIEEGEYEDGYRWTRSIREAEEFSGEDEEEDSGFESELALFEIEVTVTWPESETREGVYTLKTLKVAPRPD